MQSTRAGADFLSDPGLLEVLWNRLIAAADDQAVALKETSFTSIVRESDDLSAAVFDTRGRMIAQAVTGSPGHINSLASAMKHFVVEHPDCRPGDILITNDPWVNSGHLNDLTIVTPIHLGDDLVGYVGSTCHQLDIGGGGLSADGKDVYAEGLRIPPMKLYEEGRANETLFELFRANVRMPRLAIGDIDAQVLGNNVGSARVRALMEEFGLESLELLGDEICRRSERALRNAIDELPQGSYEATLEIDGVGSPLTLKCRVDVGNSKIIVDFDGSSPQVDYGVNVVHNYTAAYTTFAVNCALAPGVPHNDGTFRAIEVTAPEGSVLNAKFPAPVAGRHTVGHFIPNLILAALAEAAPNAATAHGSSSLWVTTIYGHATEEYDDFVAVFFASGGMGARRNSDGLATISFPSGAGTTPIEETEVTYPLVIEEKSLRPDSGGAGEHRGGLGQRIRISVRTDQPWTVACLCNRLEHAAPGLEGGEAGAPGRFTLSDGSRPDPKVRTPVPRGGSILLELPGGGGFGPPSQRSRQLTERDLREGKVTNGQQGS